MTAKSDATYDLWVLPPASHSRWFAKLDWYLNWQMSKGLAHQRQKPSLELLKVLETTGMALISAPETGSTPLMVSAIGHVDALRCVVVDVGNGLRGWLERSHELMQGLQAKRVRLFLPKGAEISEAKEHLKKLGNKDLEIDFATDEEAT